MTAAAASKNTVTVACKLPAGFYMQAYKMEEIQEPVLGGGTRTAARAVPVGPKVRIRGNAAPQGSVATGLVEGGYVLTPNVPEETAKAWMEANKESGLVKNRLVFISEKQEDAVSRSKNNHAVLSGLERLDITTRSEKGATVPNDYRWPRSKNVNVTAVTTADK